MFPERRVESLAACMEHMDKQRADFYAKDLTLNAKRQRLWCTWALTVAKYMTFIEMKAKEETNKSLLFNLSMLADLTRGLR